MIEILSFAIEKGFSLRGLTLSPIQGPKGNVEFLVWLELGKSKAQESADQEIMITRAMSNEE